MTDGNKLLVETVIKKRQSIKLVLPTKIIEVKNVNVAHMLFI